MTDSNEFFSKYLLAVHLKMTNYQRDVSLTRPPQTTHLSKHKNAFNFVSITDVDLQVDELNHLCHTIRVGSFTIFHEIAHEVFNCHKMSF